jgi:CubicO group peptidase (beta-lactamase class C family)
MFNEVMKNIKLSGFLFDQMKQGYFPSAVYLVAEKGEVKFADAVGFAVVEPERIVAKINTIYDLASLTKPLVVALLSAKLLQENEISLEDNLERYFSEFSRHRKILLKNLFSHDSGLRDWMPFYLLVESREKILSFIASVSPEAESGEKVIYSDLNFLILTFLLEKIFGEPIDRIAENEIFKPLKLSRTFYNPPKRFLREIAASERGNEYEKNTCLERGYSIDKIKWRDYVIWGEVHDGNCWFMNGISGHAGLFSDVMDTFLLAKQFLPSTTSLLKAEICSKFCENLTRGLNEARSLGFQLAETSDSTASEALSKNSFGHLGFTGTSLWIDPQTERIFILFTNRTHNCKPPFTNINSVRKKFHKLAVEELNLTGN